MTSIFNTGAIPNFSKEQKKTRRLAWKQNSVRTKLQQSSKPVVVYRNPNVDSQKNG